MLQIQALEQRKDVMWLRRAIIKEHTQGLKVILVSAVVVQVVHPHVANLFVHLFDECIARLGQSTLRPTTQRG